MTKRIYKFKIPREGNVIKQLLPDKFQVLISSADYVWILLDHTAATKPYTFIVVGTGFDIPNSAIYINTYEDAPFVWHIIALPTSER